VQEQEVYTEGQGVGGDGEDDNNGSDDLPRGVWVGGIAGGAWSKKSKSEEQGPEI